MVGLVRVVWTWWWIVWGEVGLWWGVYYGWWGQGGVVFGCCDEGRECGGVVMVWGIGDIGDTIIIYRNINRIQPTVVLLLVSLLDTCINWNIFWIFIIWKAEKRKMWDKLKCSRKQITDISYQLTDVSNEWFIVNLDRYGLIIYYINNI